ncbi:MAG: VIT family protein [Actinobacteria bacterium]|nr:VIT family protein [Actinomycetota bacterium]
MSLHEIHKRNEDHKTNRAGWLRAAVLGVNDGLVSTASLMIGIVSAGKNDFVLTAGAAAITAGAMSMAVGEYVSVRSQNDIEESDRRLEKEHLELDPEGELEELTQIYQSRGLSRTTAEKVAQELHDHDALGAHLRDELGQFEATKARPLQAAVASALSFTSFIGLVMAGIVSAKTAGSKIGRTTLRIVMGGALGMAITAGVGQIAHISGI